MGATLAEVQASIHQQRETSKWFGKDQVLDTTHAIIGVGEEAGELLGLIKKDTFRGKSHEREQWLSEFGDVLWYLVAALDLKGFTFDEVWEYNCQKLQDRRQHGKNGASWEG